MEAEAKAPELDAKEVARAAIASANIRAELAQAAYKGLTSL